MPYACFFDLRNSVPAPIYVFASFFLVLINDDIYATNRVHYSVCMSWNFNIETMSQSCSAHLFKNNGWERVSNKSVFIHDSLLKRKRELPMELIVRDTWVQIYTFQFLKKCCTADRDYRIVTVTTFPFRYRNRQYMFVHTVFQFRTDPVHIRYNFMYM